MNILITGNPGTGKTTLIKKLVHTFDTRVSGFYTEEIRKQNERVGFAVRTLDGHEGTLAHIDIRSPYRIGKYKVDVESFERIALPALEKRRFGSKIIIIDEIGPMELFSEIFKKRVLEILDSPSSVIATIKLKGSDFVAMIKSRNDVELYTLTRDTRETVFRSIVERL